MEDKYREPVASVPIPDPDTFFFDIFEKVADELAKAPEERQKILEMLKSEYEKENSPSEAGEKQE